MTDRGTDDERPGQSDLFEASSAVAPLHIGHRERLRDRFLKGGADALPDYKLLELVLFRAIPRRDTKDLSKRLIARFGSFAEVVNAPEVRLKEIAGVGEAVVTELKLVHAAATRLARPGLIQRPLLTSGPDVISTTPWRKRRSSGSSSTSCFSTNETGSLRMRCRAKERSTTRPCTWVKSSNGHWNFQRLPSFWFTTTPPVIQCPPVRIST